MKEEVGATIAVTKEKKRKIKDTSLLARNLCYAHQVQPLTKLKDIGGRQAIAELFTSNSRLHLWELARDACAAQEADFGWPGLTE